MLGASALLSKRLALPRLGLAPDAAASLVAEAPGIPIREIFRRFWPYTRAFRRWMWLTLALLAIVPALETASIWMFKVLVDQVLVPRDVGPFAWVALGYLAITLVRGVVSFVDSYLSTWLGERFLLSLRLDFFAHLQRLSLDFFERRRLGDIVSRLTGDIASIEAFVLSGVSDALSYGLRLIFFAGALFYLQWDLAAVALTVAPLFWFAARRLSKLIKQASRAKRRHAGSITAVSEESLSNIQLVQAYNRQDTERARFQHENQGAFDATMAATRLRGFFSPLVDLIELLGAMLVVGLGTWKLSKGELSLGGLLVFLTYLNGLYSPIRGLAKLANTIHGASAGAERIIEFLDEEPPVRDAAGARSLERVRGRLLLDHVSFRYPGTDVDALSGVSCFIRPGETVALVGASGAGKSTLVKLLLRFYDPTAGAIELDGHDLRDVRLQSLRDNVAVVLQETLVMHGTARDNIAYGRPDATEAEILAAARAAGAHEFIARLPDGYDTVLGQKGRRLSGGERQRLALARAMVRDAPMLVLDEPTTGLDAGTADRVLAPMREFMRDRTTIVISHNLLTVRDADRILVLDGGRIVEHGDHDALMAVDGTYAALYRFHHAPETQAPPPLRLVEAV